MSHTIHTLKNGLTVVFVPRKGSKICKFSVVVEAGARYDDVGNYPSGTAHFLEHMTHKGTQKYKNKDELLNIVLDDGGVRNALTYKEVQEYFVSTLDRFVEPAFDFLSQLLFHATLLEDTFETERTTILAECKKSDSNPDRVFFNNGVNKAMYKNRAMQISGLGTLESISQITLEHVRSFYKEYFKPKRMTLFIVGDIEEKTTLLLVKKYFENNVQEGEGRGPGLPSLEIKEPQNRNISFPGQSDVRISMRLFLDEVDRNGEYSFVLLMSVLAGGSNSRLLRKLRIERGLIYGIHYSSNFYPEGLLLGISTQSDRENIKTIKKLITEEIESVAKEGITQAELAQYKNQFIQDIERQSDSTESLTKMYTAEQRIYGEIFNKEREIKKISNVTQDEIQKAAVLVSSKTPSWIEMDGGEE
jgi:predicted Zn-dependent peptidase